MRRFAVVLSLDRECLDSLLSQIERMGGKVHSRASADSKTDSLEIVKNGIIQK